jgi:hypothetical protein
MRALLLLALQWLLVIPLSLTWRLQRLFARASHACVRPYYWACVRRRRAAGEPEWKEIDWAINIPPPADHPYWTSGRLATAEEIKAAGATLHALPEFVGVDDDPPKAA